MTGDSRRWASSVHERNSHRGNFAATSSNWRGREASRGMWAIIRRTANSIFWTSPPAETSSITPVVRNHIRTSPTRFAYDGVRYSTSSTWSCLAYWSTASVSGGHKCAYVTETLWNTFGESRSMDARMPRSMIILHKCVVDSTFSGTLRNRWLDCAWLHVIFKSSLKIPFRCRIIRMITSRDVLFAVDAMLNDRIAESSRILHARINANVRRIR